MRKTENIRYSKSVRENMLNLYLPESDSFDIFIYFHGGSLTGGSRNDADIFAAPLALKGIGTASVEYRLLPNAGYPDFIWDCAEAVSWVFKNKSKLGNIKRIFVGGSSAGGYLSMMLCFDGKYLQKFGILPTDIDGFIHDAGQPTCHFSILKNKGTDPKRVIVDESAPLFHVGLCDKYAPMLFIVSDNDMAGRYEQTLLMVRTMKNFGFEPELKIMHGGHCHYLGQTAPDGGNLFADIVSEYILSAAK